MFQKKRLSHSKVDHFSPITVQIYVTNPITTHYLNVREKMCSRSCLHLNADLYYQFLSMLSTSYKFSQMFLTNFLPRKIPLQHRHAGDRPQD